MVSSWALLFSMHSLPCLLEGTECHQKDEDYQTENHSQIFLAMRSGVGWAEQEIEAWKPSAKATALIHELSGEYSLPLNSFQGFELQGSTYAQICSNNK